jgi:hypothetical protein
MAVTARTWLGLAALALVACDGGQGERAAAAPAAPAFDLVCDSTDTRTASTLFCMRIDTRTGDVLRVDLSRLPQSNGPTGAADEPAGTYQLVCDATNTESRGDFRCVRVNRRTGELLLIRLPKVGQVPPA